MKYSLLLIVLIATACNNKSDKQPETKALDSNFVIKEALTYADSLASVAKTLTYDSAYLEGLSTEGGLLYFHKDADSLVVLLEAQNYGEMGRNEERIWLKEKQPVLEYLKDINYDKPMYEPGSKIDNTKITYVVFHNGAPFALLDSAKHKIAADSATLNEWASRVKDVLPDYLSQITKKE
jgi:hypothetical protein